MLPYDFEHVRRRFYLLDVIDDPLLHLIQFLGGVVEAKVRVGVQRHPDVTVPHQILQRLGIHTGFCHIAAVGVTADVRRYLWHLDAVDPIVLRYHLLESVLPMAGDLACPPTIRLFKRKEAL